MEEFDDLDDSQKARVIQAIIQHEKIYLIKPTAKNMLQLINYIVRQISSQYGIYFDERVYVLKKPAEKYNKKSYEVIEMIIKLRAYGLTNFDIARITNTSRPTVGKICREHKAKIEEIKGYSDYAEKRQRFDSYKKALLYSSEEGLLLEFIE